MHLANWGVKSGAPLLKLEGHTSHVNAVACHGAGDDWRIVSGSDDGTVRVWDGAAGAVYPVGSRVASVALAPRAGEVGVFASVGASFARLALRDGPSKLEERIEEEDTPSKAEDRARRKAAAQLSDEERARRIVEAEARRKAEAKKQKSAACVIS